MDRQDPPDKDPHTNEKPGSFFEGAANQLT